jgi:ABC-type uncharacterized transport system substrate-binding protein
MTRFTSSLLVATLGVSLALAASQPAAAHPHVWIAAEAEILFAPDGRVTGIRHRWSFDEAYSVFSTQGLDKNNDGKLTPDELEELAKVNVESLAEYNYFSVLKLNGKKQDMLPPIDYGLSFENKTLTLALTTPLKAPMSAKVLGLEVGDPELFVSFAWKAGETPVTLKSAPAGCTLTLTRPKPDEALQQGKLSEDFFNSAAARAMGTQLANKVLVACP